MNDKTTLPLSWFVSGLFAMGGVIAMGTMWVASVNTRLTMIEQKLDLMTKVAVVINK